jgi:hypothetical protein
MIFGEVESLREIYIQEMSWCNPSQETEIIGVPDYLSIQW